MRNGEDGIYEKNYEKRIVGQLWANLFRVIDGIYHLSVDRMINDNMSGDRVSPESVGVATRSRKRYIKLCGAARSANEFSKLTSCNQTVSLNMAAGN